MTTFNGVTGRALSRALQSLSQSTSLTVTVNEVTYRGERLCSPLISHRTVDVRPALTVDVAGVVTLANEKMSVSVAHRLSPPPGYAPTGTEWHIAILPISAILAATVRLAAIVPGLDQEIRSALVRPGAPAIVSVGVLLPVVTGWTEDGHPVYAEQAVTDSDAYYGIIEASFDPDTE